MSPRAEKAHKTKLKVASPSSAETSNPALYSSLMKLPSHVRWMVVNHLCIMGMMEQSIEKVEQAKVRQWAWLQEWEANKHRDIIWVEQAMNGLTQQQATYQSPTLAEPVEQQDKLECQKVLKTPAIGSTAAAAAPLIISVMTYEAEELISDSDMIATDSSSSGLVLDGLGGDGSSSSDSSIVSATLHAALESLVVELQVAAYRVVMCTLFITALSQIAFTSLVISNAAAVAAHSCRRLSDTFTGAVKTLVSPRSSIDAM